MDKSNIACPGSATNQTSKSEPAVVAEVEHEEDNDDDKARLLIDAPSEWHGCDLCRAQYGAVLSTFRWGLVEVPLGRSQQEI